MLCYVCDPSPSPYRHSHTYLRRHRGVKLLYVSPPHSQYRHSQPKNFSPVVKSWPRESFTHTMPRRSNFVVAVGASMRGSAGGPPLTGEPRSLGGGVTIIPARLRPAAFTAAGRGIDISSTGNGCGLQEVPCSGQELHGFTQKPMNFHGFSFHGFAHELTALSRVFTVFSRVRVCSSPMKFSRFGCNHEIFTVCPMKISRPGCNREGSCETVKLSRANHETFMA